MAVATARQPARIGARRTAAGVVAVGLVLSAFVAAWAVHAFAGLYPGPNEYNVAAWEVRNIPGKWLFLAGELIRGEASEAEQDETLRRFFELNALIDTLSIENSDATSRGSGVDPSAVAHLETLIAERERIENQVEATLESRLSKVIEEQGLTRNFLFDVVWPPVDAEFTEAPRALARSPRDRIELLGSRLLREDLTLAEAAAIEEEVSRSEDVSALSFATSGIGAYPTIIDHPTDYRRALEVIAHEWMHNYLFFRPLGFNYYGSNDLRTMNETVADLVGRELAERVAERWPLEPVEAQPAVASTPRDESIDLRSELKKLRGEVDELLAAGRVEEAEDLMERRRQELVGAGYFIRKINQAYFAYLNLYAGEDGSAAATNPIGPKIDELRQRSPSLSSFVDVVGNVTSAEELDEALESLR